MTFLKRLRLYGIGFALGLGIVYGMFGTRSCVTPNEMKMQELVFQQFELSSVAKCKLACMKKNEALLKIELRHFEVDYDLSAPRKEPCGEYYLKPKKEHATMYGYSLVMLDCDSITRINDIRTDNTVCHCQ